MYTRADPEIVMMVHGLFYENAYRRVSHWGHVGARGLCIRMQCSEGGSRKGRQKDYNPGEWSEHFAEKKDIQLDEQTIFRVYLSKPSEKPNAPVILLLHGGGYSALTWSHFTVNSY